MRPNSCDSARRPESYKQAACAPIYIKRYARKIRYCSIG